MKVLGIKVKLRVISLPPRRVVSAYNTINIDIITPAILSLAGAIRSRHLPFERDVKMLDNLSPQE